MSGSKDILIEQLRERAEKAERDLAAVAMCNSGNCGRCVACLVKRAEKAERERVDAIDAMNAERETLAATDAEIATLRERAEKAERELARRDADKDINTAFNRSLVERAEKAERERDDLRYLSFQQREVIERRTLAERVGEAVLRAFGDEHMRYRSWAEFVRDLKDRGAAVDLAPLIYLLLSIADALKEVEDAE